MKGNGSSRLILVTSLPYGVKVTNPDGSYVDSLQSTNSPLLIITNDGLLQEAGEVINPGDWVRIYSMESQLAVSFQPSRKDAGLPHVLLREQDTETICRLNPVGDGLLNGITIEFLYAPEANRHLIWGKGSKLCYRRSDLYLSSETKSKRAQWLVGKRGLEEGVLREGNLVQFACQRNGKCLTEISGKQLSCSRERRHYFYLMKVKAAPSSGRRIMIKLAIVLANLLHLCPVRLTNLGYVITYINSIFMHASYIGRLNCRSEYEFEL